MFEGLPADVLWTCVLPKCCIDVRLSLGVPPRKLDMAAYETGATGDAFRRRYSKAKLPCSQANGKIVTVRVPLWGVDLAIDEGSEHEEHEMGADVCPVQLHIRFELGTSRARTLANATWVCVRRMDYRFPAIDPRSKPKVVSQFFITSSGHMC